MENIILGFLFISLGRQLNRISELFKKDNKIIQNILAVILHIIFLWIIGFITNQLINFIN